MDNKNKTIFLAISIMFIICTCFTSLSFSYFINPSTTETDVLTSSLVSNELTYDENKILAPNETRVVSLNITSYNSFDSYFKVYFKGNIKVECSSRTMDLIKSFDKKTIDVTVVNETEEYQDFQFGIESALSGEEIVLKDGEFGI